MHLQIGYANAPIASGLLGTEGAKSRALVRAAPLRYVDALFVQVVPAATHRNHMELTRAQAAIRLYSSIFNFAEVATVKLHVSAWA